MASFAPWHLLVACLVAMFWWASLAIAQEGIDSPRASATALVAVDLVDDYDHGVRIFDFDRDRFVIMDNVDGSIRVDDKPNLLTAFSITGFGEDIARAALVNDPVLSGSSAIVLETGAGGFTESNTFIGFSKSMPFAMDASAFTHVAYFARSPNTDDDVRHIVLRLVVGDGGVDGGTGAVWSQIVPLDGSFLPDLTDPRNTSLSKLSEYTRVLVPLDTATGFAGQQGRTFDVSELTAINFELRRWNGGGNDGVRTVYIDDVIFLDLSRPHRLRVETTPVAGIGISGDFNGQTPSPLVDVADSASVTLTAPASAMVGEVNHAFQHWTVNGRIIGESSASTVAFTVLRDTSAIAVYEALPPPLTLTVRTKPESDAAIRDGDGQAVPAVGFVNDNANIVLQAPESHTINGAAHRFVHWLVNDRPQPLFEPTIAFQITEDTIAEAVYDDRHFVIVSSLPVEGVEISASPADITVIPDRAETPFLIPVETNGSITLQAPASLATPAVNFRRWVTTEGNVATRGTDGVVALALANVTADVLAEAVFSPALVFGAQWNLMSMPVESSSSIGAILGGSVAATAVWSWQVNYFTEVGLSSAFATHTGYWIFNPGSAAFVPVTGQPAASTAALAPGWNLIGISGDEPVSSSVVGTVTGNFWAWDNLNQRYIAVDGSTTPVHKRGKLFPGLGYWVYNGN